jgi:hypothetical protein
MTNEKPKITRNELAKDVVYAFAIFLKSYDKEPFRTLYSKSSSHAEFEQIFGNGSINNYLRDHFQSHKFNAEYQPLSNTQLIQTRETFLSSGIEMKDFINRMIEIYDGQEYLKETEPNMRVSWNFPEFEECNEEFNKVKMKLLDF